MRQPSTAYATCPPFGMFILSREEYAVNTEGGFFIVWPSHPSGECPNCQGRLKVRDTVERHFRDQSGKKHWFRIRRLACNGCKRLHRELPDIVIPYKHYKAEYIEAEIDNADGRLEPTEQEQRLCSADYSTLKRWILWFRSIQQLLNQRLIAIQQVLFALLFPLLGEELPLEKLRSVGGGWLGQAYAQSVNAGYPAYTPSLHRTP